MLSLTSSFSIAFTPTPKPTTKFNFVGDTKPLNFFDPLRFTKGKSENYLKYLREAELQHARLAMISSLALPIIDYNSDVLAINYISSMPAMSQISMLLFFSVVEYYRMISNYENPFMMDGKTFTIKKDKEPGEYINIKTSDTLKERELNNGRLAMIGILGYIAQELVTQTPIF